MADHKGKLYKAKFILDQSVRPKAAASCGRPDHTPAMPYWGTAVLSGLCQACILYFACIFVRPSLGVDGTHHHLLCGEGFCGCQNILDFHLTVLVEETTNFPSKYILWFLFHCPEINR